MMSEGTFTIIFVTVGLVAFIVGMVFGLHWERCEQRSRRRRTDQGEVR